MKLFAGMILALLCVVLQSSTAFPHIRSDLTAQRQAEAQKIVELTDFLGDMVKKMIEGYRSKVPDPFEVATYQVRVAQEVMNISLKLDNVEMDGAKGYQVDSVKASLIQEHMDLTMSLPSLKVKGHYDLKGLVEEVIPLYGNGDFFVEIDGFQLNVSSGFVMDGFSFKGIKDLALDFDLKTLKVTFNGIMGNLSHVINEVVNDDGKKILQQEWALHQAELTQKLQDFINSHLASQVTQQLNLNYLEGLYLYQTYTQEVTGNANEFVDNLMMNARKYITDKHLDPYPLPDEYKGFSKKIIITWHGHASLTKGTVSGQSTVHRDGDASLVIDKDILTVNAGIGVNYIQAGYHCEATFMSIGPKFDVSANAPHPDIVAQVQANLTSMTMTLTDFHIEDVGHITVKFEGLGILNWLANIIGGWVVNIFKGPIIGKVESVARTEIENALAGMTPPVALFESVQRYYKV